MSANVRSIPAPWHLRQRRHAVIVCRDDPQEYEALRDRLAGLEVELVVEQHSEAGRTVPLWVDPGA